MSIGGDHRAIGRAAVTAGPDAFGIRAALILGGLLLISP
jgi:hypothetical protein